MEDSRLTNSRDNGWIVICVTYSPESASIIAGRLETEGIRTWVHQEPVARALGISVGSLGEMKVLVYPEDYAQALAILEGEMRDTLPENTDLLVQDPEDQDNEPHID